ncbi:MAG: dihydrofolate reductase family protein, partial [Acidimicrobiales bacterium]|nr:dihydrofolate reductase family protein [Acidimicrobiales bacterium]
LGCGAWPVARIAVVSNSLSVDPAARLFSAGDSRPIIITSEAADVDRRNALAEVADVIVAGTGRVDMTAALTALGELGARVVLSEGGPSLNAQLAAEGLIDEMCVSLAPMVVAGDARRIVHGAALAEPIDLELRQVLTEDHYLFLHYLRAEPITD